MKTFQKIALVSAIAAAPFAAQADLTPMTESLMGDTTGQAGVTIEIELGAGGIDIGSVVYTDEGTVTLENINVGLTGEITQTIDVNAAGDLEIVASAPGSVGITMGGGEFSALKLGGTNGDSEVINNLDLAVTLGASTTTIMSLGTDASGLGALGNAGVQNTATNNYSTDLSSMAIKMSTSLEITDMNVGLFGYTNDQANILGQGHSTTVAAKATLETAPTGVITYDAAGVATSDNAADALAVGTYNGTLSAVKSGIANGSAIQISGVTVKNTAANILAGGSSEMSMDQVIWAKGGDSADGGGLYIQMGNIAADISVAGIAIGGASIGSVAINGLSMAGMTQRIYGH